MDNRPFDSCAAMLRVMAHPVRLAIVHALRGRRQSVGDLCEKLGVTQPAVSRHLSVLRREGLVSYAEEGAKRNYFLASPEVVSPLLDALAAKYAADGHGDPFP